MNIRTAIRVLRTGSGLLMVLLLFGFATVAEGGTTPRDILRMHRDGLSTEVLLEHLQVTEVDGRLTEHKARVMRKAGVAESVLRAFARRAGTDAGDKNEHRPVTNRGESRDNPVSKPGNREEKRRSSSSSPGTLLLRSRSEETVWFRRDPGARTLYLSGTERSSMPGLSAGEGMEMSMQPGTWTIKTPDVRAGHELHFSPGRTGRITINGVDQQGVTVSWQPDHPDGGERQLVLERQQLGMKQVREALKSKQEASSRSRRQTSPRGGVQYRTDNGWLDEGFYGGRWGGRHRFRGYGYSYSPYHGLLLPGNSFFLWDNRYRHRRPYHHYRRRSHGFDFQLDLNHDFEADGLRGTLRFRSGRSGHHDQFYHFD